MNPKHSNPIKYHCCPDPYDLWSTDLGVAVRSRYYAGSLLGKAGAVKINTKDIDIFFIVGMPRSGTKLLRDLLNRNPAVGLPMSETEFWPALIRKFGINPNFQKNTKESLIKFFKTTSFAHYLGVKLDISSLRGVTSYEQLFRAFLLPYVNKPAIKLIGDKTPTYLFHIELLKTVFPNARFICIVRDPRDCALSARKTW